MSELGYGSVRPAAAQADLASLGPYLFWLMFRNVASDGLVFTDPHPEHGGIVSAPGCVLASPSYEQTGTHVNQDYVYHWTRDAAVVAIELAWAYSDGRLPANQPLIDYVTFSRTAQQAPGDFDRAAFYIDGAKRDGWTDQSDGAALQTIALLGLYQQLDAATQAVAASLISANLDFLQTAYQGQTYNLWEEEYGYSFFTRSVQLRCFQAIAANTVGLPVPSWLPGAMAWLITALDGHWNGTVYQSVLPAPADSRAPYDPNIDIVMAVVYGAESATDPRILATAAQLRTQWADPASPCYYPINGTDAARGLGPLLGRYPGDVYDGDTADPAARDHPWALTTANFAELYYRLAAKAGATHAVPSDDLSATFLEQVGITGATPATDAVTALRAAGDAMLQAVIAHSDHLELSEQFDAVTGFEKSVANLSWSYAAFLSALRARATIPS